MSIFSNEEENELINFENLEILDLFGSDSEIESAECFDINTDKKKIILIKMSNIGKNDDKSMKKSSTKSKSKESDVSKEEIHEVKYNLCLGLFRDCVPAIKECEEIVNNKNLIGQRVIIQDLEINGEQKILHPKKYIFIPPSGQKVLFFEIEGNKVLKISKGENISMELGKKDGENYKKEKDLNKFDENARPDIKDIFATKKEDKSSENKRSSHENSTTKNTENISLNNNQQIKNNINPYIKNESFESIKSEIEIESKSNKNKSKKSNNSNKSMQTDDSILSKLDHSSENELEQGILFYDEIEKGNKYTKYSYFDSFRKEIDGIYYQHSGINLGIGKKELNLDNYKKYEDFENEYDTGEKNNDLHGYIIMKNFEETAIPKNTPFIIEIKAGFDLITLLKQIM